MLILYIGRNKKQKGEWKMKKVFGYARVRNINGTRKDYGTVGINLSKENAVVLAKSLLKAAKRDNVVLTTFKNRVDGEGMRLIVSAY